MNLGNKNYNSKSMLGVKNFMPHSALGHKLHMEHQVMFQWVIQEWVYIMSQTQV
jgi:hypothetical protein